MSFIKKNKKDINNKYFAVCGVVEIDQRILFVRHTYGPAEGRILIPGDLLKKMNCRQKLLSEKFWRKPVSKRLLSP